MIRTENRRQVSTTLVPSPRPREANLEIDVLGYIDQFANTLRTGEDSCACEEALAILVRWQFDEMLDTASRTAARDLVIEYGGRHAETLAEAHLPWRLPAR